jgi:hypothetical protein
MNYLNKSMEASVPSQIRGRAAIVDPDLWRRLPRLPPLPPSLPPIETAESSPEIAPDLDPVLDKTIIESILKFIFAGFGLKWLLSGLRNKLSSKNRPSAPVFFGIVGILGLFVAMVYASISESQGHSIM